MANRRPEGVDRQRRRSVTATELHELHVLAAQVGVVLHVLAGGLIRLGNWKFRDVAAATQYLLGTEARRRA
jgi:hypothetical protein